MVNDPKDASPTMWVGHKGYVRIRSEYLGEDYNVSVHRLLAVAEFGFDAVCDMEVHHKNGCKRDNRPANIELMTSEEHGRLSALTRWHGYEKAKEMMA